jgi:nucleoside-diphosphate-sugar epimerase
MTHRVLLTGASGFIGRAVIEPLRQTGFAVHAVARRPLDIIQTNLTWHVIDLLDQEAMKSLVRRIMPSHLLHLAWYAAPDKYWAARENLDWLSASLALLQVFAESGGARVVMAGSCAEYGPTSDVCYENSTPLIQHTLYGTCKHATQTVLAAYSGQFGLSSAWGRVFLPYGPNEHPVRLVSSVVCALLEGQPALCTSGEQVRDFIYIDDVANAFVVLLRSNVEGAVNIASGSGVAVKEVAMQLGDLLGRRDLVKLGARPTAQNEPSFVVADLRRLTNEVGWRPTISLDEGLARTIDWWRKQAMQNASASETVRPPISGLSSG